MSRATKIISFIEQNQSGYNNPPHKRIPPGYATAVEAAVKKYLKEAGIEASVDLKFMDRTRGGSAGYDNPSIAYIEVHLDGMTVDEFNHNPDLHSFNRLVSSFHTDWGIVGETILIGSKR